MSSNDFYTVIKQGNGDYSVHHTWAENGEQPADEATVTFGTLEEVIKWHAELEWPNVPEYGLSFHPSVYADLCPDGDRQCTYQGCPEHPRHDGLDHTYEQHHDPSDHVGDDPCYCPVYT